MIKKLTITFDYVVDYIDKVDKDGKKTTDRVYTKSWGIIDNSFRIIESNPSIIQFKTIDGDVIGYNMNSGIVSYIIEDV